MIFRRFSPLRYAPVFGIEADKVYTNLAQWLLLQHTGHFEHDRHSAGSVVGSQDRLFPVGRIRVIVAPRAAVPMGTDQYSFFCIRIYRSDDVTAFQHCAVITFQVGILVGDGGSISRKLFGNIVAAGLVCLAVRSTRTEITLIVCKLISAVGIECRAFRINLSRLFRLGCGRCILFTAAAQQTNGSKRQGAPIFLFPIFRLLLKVLYLLHHTQEVSSPYFPDILVVVPVLNQAACEVDQFGS